MQRLHSEEPVRDELERGAQGGRARQSWQQAAPARAAELTEQVLREM